MHYRAAIVRCQELASLNARLMREGGGGKKGSPRGRIGVSEASITHKESVMQCTVPTMPSATPARTPLAVSPRSLTAAFAHIPDPRRARSVTYALPALLALAVAAMLSNHLSVLAIAEWGARQSPDLLRTLGFPAGRTPCQSTLQRLFSKLDGHALSAALGAHFAPAVVPVPAADAADATVQGVAMDGKAQRGRLPFQQGGCPVHALTAFCHEPGVVLAQEPIEPGQGTEQGTEKGEAELTVAPTLLARVAWPGGCSPA